MNRTRVNPGTIAAACALCLGLLGVSTASALGLARSASKVDVTAAHARQEADAGARLIRVELAIADGWHVNAHPASLDFLVATSIEATAGGHTVPLHIDWPEGHASGIKLAGTAVKVYSDNTVIPVRLSPEAAQAAEAGTLTLNVRVQACSNDGLCLPPSTLQVQPADS